MEAGYKYKEEFNKLKKEILCIGGGGIGTMQGDRIIEEAELDPTINLKPDEFEEGLDNGVKVYN